LVESCTGSTSGARKPDDTPLARPGPARAVDPCDLLPTATASQVLDLPLEVVGKGVGPARLGTVSCILGQRFAEPLVTVSFTPDAIAPKVFDDAYGTAAGGNPLSLDHLGDRAFLRTESDVRSLHVFVHGAVLTVLTSLEPLPSRQPLRQAEVIALARRAVAVVPKNAGPPDDDTACPNVPASTVAAALGRPPTLATRWTMGDGSVMCSWGGEPGSATAEVIRDQRVIQDFRRTHHLAGYLDLGDLGAGPGIRALSSVDVAGDLVIVAPAQTLVLMTVVPSAGFSDPDIPTTDAERQLAKAILATLA
jgi:hypothetical protein